MKIPRVTRTMNGSIVKIKVVNRSTSIMFDCTYVLPRYYKDESKLTKLLQKKLSDKEPDCLVLRVVENERKKFFCQMLEDEYFDRAEKTAIE